MSRWTPCKRNDFIRKLRGLGFDGPFSGSNPDRLTRFIEALNVYMKSFEACITGG